MNELILSNKGRAPVYGEIEFLGEVGDLVTYSTLFSYFNVTQGTLNTATGVNRWLHFILDGKELFVSKISVMYAISWNHLYSRGLVYGTNSNGLYPTGTPTNQYRTITIADRVYKCRLLKGADNDPYTGGNGYYLEGSHNSEFSRLFYSIVPNDQFMTDYTGPKLANYTQEELNITAGDGRATWCQETSSSDTTLRVGRGHYSASFLASNSSFNTALNFGWRPVLELVP